MRTYKLTRAADRAAMAEHLAGHFARVDGVTVTNEPDKYEPRRINVMAEAAGVRCALSIDGDSTWGVFPTWNFDYATRNGRLFTSAFQSSLDISHQGRRGHHKASGPFAGGCKRGAEISEEALDVFAATINRAMRNVLSGAAFEMETAA